MLLTTVYIIKKVLAFLVNVTTLRLRKGDLKSHTENKKETDEKFDSLKKQIHPT